jgi:hypothetical protein
MGTMINLEKIQYDPALIARIETRMAERKGQEEASRVLAEEKRLREAYHVPHITAIMLAAGKCRVSLTALLGPPDMDGETGDQVYGVVIKHACLNDKYVEKGRAVATIVVPAFAVITAHPDVTGYAFYQGGDYAWDYRHGKLVFPADYPITREQAIWQIVRKESLYPASLYAEAWLLHMPAEKLEGVLVDNSKRYGRAPYSVQPKVAFPPWLCGGAFDQAAARKTSTCQTCGGAATDFRTEAARREYGISAMCQACQDEVFGNENWPDRCPSCNRRVQKPGLCDGCARPSSH